MDLSAQALNAAPPASYSSLFDQSASFIATNLRAPEAAKVVQNVPNYGLFDYLVIAAIVVLLVIILYVIVVVLGLIVDKVFGTSHFADWSPQAETEYLALQTLNGKDHMGNKKNVLAPRK